MERIPFNVDANMARLIGRENVSKLDGAIIELIKSSHLKALTALFNFFSGISGEIKIPSIAFICSFIKIFASIFSP